VLAKGSWWRGNARSELSTARSNGGGWSSPAMMLRLRLGCDYWLGSMSGDWGGLLGGQWRQLVADGCCPRWPGAHRKEGAAAEVLEARDVHSEGRKDAIGVSKIS
jgi:hypothetical protein